MWALHHTLTSQNTNLKLKHIMLLCHILCRLDSVSQTLQEKIHTYTSARPLCSHPAHQDVSPPSELLAISNRIIHSSPVAMKTKQKAGARQWERERETAGERETERQREREREREREKGRESLEAVFWSMRQAGKQNCFCEITSVDKGGFYRSWPSVSVFCHISLYLIPLLSLCLGIHSPWSSVSGIVRNAGRTKAISYTIKMLHYRG